MINKILRKLGKFSFCRRIMDFIWIRKYLRWIKYAKEHNMWITITEESCNAVIKDYGSNKDIWNRYK